MPADYVEEYKGFIIRRLRGFYYDIQLLNEESGYYGFSFVSVEGAKNWIDKKGEKQKRLQLINLVWRIEDAEDNIEKLEQVIDDSYQELRKQRLYPADRAILTYLERRKAYTSPTKIARDVFGNENSSYVCRHCKKMVKKGLLKWDRGEYVFVDIFIPCHK
jgi:DNA-binding MarR family transcriptional regulator